MVQAVEWYEISDSLYIMFSKGNANMKATLKMIGIVN